MTDRACPVTSARHKATEIGLISSKLLRKNVLSKCTNMSLVKYHSSLNNTKIKISHIVRLSRRVTYNIACNIASQI